YAAAHDVAYGADADVAALRMKGRLLLAHEFFVSDQLQRLVEDRLVVAAVVNERGKVLVDEMGLVGKGIRRNEIAAADFGRIEAELARGDVEQAFHHEHAVLPAGAAIGRDNRR